MLFVSAQEKEYNLDEIVVTAGRTPITFSDLARSVTVLTSADIKSLPVNDIQDLLKYVNTIDLKTRGAEGVQADAGIRGGTFEQTLIMIDGVKISDPQTGHHNLNIPLSLDNVQRIEVLKGQGSRIFGPNAFAGAVNIITKKNKNADFSISTLGGEHGLYNFSLFSSYPVTCLGNNFSFSKKKSNGYRHNTDFDITEFSLSQNYSVNQNTVNVFFGYVDKKFGANNFYSDLFPNQWEHTTTKLLNITSELGEGGFSLSPKIFWRRNDDDYILDYTKPSFYYNIHKTYSYGGEIQSSVKTNIGVTSFGGEINKEEINSTNLGNHTRLKGGFFGEQLWEPFNSVSTSIGFFAYNYSNIGWKLWPGIDFAYKISNQTKIFVSFGKAFRIPDFTELYYTSPANMGNPNLTYEETTNYELGFNYNGMVIQTGTSIFFKDGKNIIDWARAFKEDPWRVENVTSVKTVGTELNFAFFPQRLNREIPITKFQLDYTYLSADRTAGTYESKYLLDNLRHQLMVNVDNILPWGLRQNWSLILRDRVNFESQLTIDTQINAELYNFDFFVRVTNIFNRTYEDFAGVLLPGRWLSAGIKYQIKNF